MSPEINGNPPSAVKRKKTKKNLPKNTETSTNSYQMFNNSIGNSSSTIPDMSTYYSVLNYTNNTEPLSLPIYHRHGSYNTNTSTPTPFLQIPSSNTNYTSLPPNFDLNIDDTKRRYSDPGLPNDDDTDDDDDSISNSFENKIIQKLTNQVNLLKECNRRLSKEVMDIRVELNLMKGQLQNNLRHFDRDYEPGMLADIIREVRDAARVREDALLAKVKYIMDEKQMSMNHLHLVTEKNRSNNDRIAKLEEQIKNLTVTSRGEDVTSITIPSTSSNNENGHSARQVLELEREALELRRELQDTRAKKEEADQKVLLLDKKLSSIMKRNDILSTSDISETGRTDSVDSVSILTTGSSINHVPRVTMSGPVTDL